MPTPGTTKMLLLFADKLGIHHLVSRYLYIVSVWYKARIACDKGSGDIHSCELQIVKTCKTLTLLKGGSRDGSEGLYKVEIAVYILCTWLCA